MMAAGGNVVDSGERRAPAQAVRGRILVGFCEAARECFGPSGLAQIVERVPPHVRIDQAPELVPSSCLAALCAAAFEGPARREHAGFRRLAALATDKNVGAARRILLGIATPTGIVRRAGELWREDFTHGRLVPFNTSPNEAVVTLHDHPFSETMHMRIAVAESIRRFVELAGGTDAAAAYDPDPASTLEVSLCWR